MRRAVGRRWPSDVPGPSSRRGSELRRGGAALGLLLALSACGSTLQESASNGLASGGTPGLGSPLSGQEGVAGGELATGDQAGAGGSSGSAASGGGTGLAGAGGNGTTGAGSGSAGGGSGPTGPVKVGMITINTAAIAGAFGAEGNDSSKPTKDFVAYMNKTGGVGGRQIEAVYYNVDGTKDANTAGQEACETWKDAKVEIVLTGGVADVLASCLAQAGIAAIDTNLLTGDAVDVARFRNRVLPNAMRMDRLFGANLKLAAERGLIKRGDTLGILREDCPWGQRTLQNTMLPLAQKLGVKVVPGTHRCSQSAADIGGVAADIQREALRFSTERVTHVIGLSTAEAFILSRFSNTASQQRYYPKYLVTSHAYPYTNSREGATINIARDALPNIYGVGYLQMYDVGDNDTPPAAQVQERERCRQAEPTMLGAASATNNQKYFLRQGHWAMCDGFFALRAMMNASGGRTSIQDITAAYQTALGNRKKVSAGLTGGFHEVTPSRIDGAGYLRPFRWNAAKNSFLYEGKAIAIP